jgi:glycosyltransferase involved in cell wall biosynthesis
VKVAALVAGGVPNPAQSGSALTVWTIVGHLLDAGHEIAVVVLHQPELDDPGASLDERVAVLRARGADVRLVPSRAGGAPADSRSRLRREWAASETELIPQFVDADAVRAVVQDLAPDTLYAYHWEAVAASRSLRGAVPRFATVVDLPQLSAWYRWRSTPGKLSRSGLARALWLQSRLRRLPPLLVRMLEECEASGNFAAHHAEWLRERGATACRYYRTPIEDRPGPGWHEARKSRPTGRPRFLLIGHLRGTSTLDGLDELARVVLPALERGLGAEGFELRIAGGYEAPVHLRETLDRPAVRFLGHLEDPDAEFSSADALLVPTSIPLGTRVRILSAWSFGCPVVAHRANALGIPELAHGENALLAGDACGLAQAALDVAEDAALRERLEEAGRAAYERWFAPPVAAVALEETLASLAVAPAPVAS